MLSGNIELWEHRFDLWEHKDVGVIMTLKTKRKRNTWKYERRCRTLNLTIRLTNSVVCRSKRSSRVIHTPVNPRQKAGGAVAKATTIQTRVTVSHLGIILTCQCGSLLFASNLIDLVRVVNANFKCPPPKKKKKPTDSLTLSCSVPALQS